MSKTMLPLEFNDVYSFTQQRRRQISADWDFSGALGAGIILVDANYKSSFIC